MRVAALAFLIAGAGLANVSASPLRVTVIDLAPAVPHVGEIHHSPEYNPTIFTNANYTRPPCGGMRGKALGFSNALRKLFGLPTIEPYFLIAPPLPIEHFQPVNVEDQHDAHHGHHNKHHEHHNEHHGNHKHGRFHHSKFSRLWKAFSQLGGWEGAAVAFVVGCGIGVVLRLIWVMTLVSYRTCVRGETVNHIYEEVPTEDRADTEVFIVGPPQYTEKAVIKEDVEEEEKLVPS